MKYFAVFALLVLAVVVVVHADDDKQGDDHKHREDPCGVKPLAADKCKDNGKECRHCLAKECFKHALKNDCETLKTCITNSQCA